MAQNNENQGQPPTQEPAPPPPPPPRRVDREIIREVRKTDDTPLETKVVTRIMPNED